MCTLYERIVELCHDRGVSPSRMCLDIGISKSTMSDMKAGRTKGITTDTAQKIADYFGVTVDYLLGKEETENAPTENGERDVLDEVDVGFYNGFKELSEEQKEAVRRMVQVMRGQHPNNKVP